MPYSKLERESIVEATRSNKDIAEAVNAEFHSGKLVRTEIGKPQRKHHSPLLALRLIASSCSCSDPAQCP